MLFGFSQGLVSIKSLFISKLSRNSKEIVRIPTDDFCPDRLVEGRFTETKVIHKDLLILQGGKTNGYGENENAAILLRTNPRKGQEKRNNGGRPNVFGYYQNGVLHCERRESVIRLRRVNGLFGTKRNMNTNIEQIIANETQRICTQFGKSFLDCDDLAKLTGLGRDNARALMKSKQFPMITVGRRQVVSVLNFVTWQMKEYL